jgi:hypothetical protein
MTHLRRSLGAWRKAYILTRGTQVGVRILGEQAVGIGSLGGTHGIARSSGIADAPTVSHYQDQRSSHGILQ